jgi:hypothetical protein
MEKNIQHQVMGDPEKGHEWTKELHGSYREIEERKSYRNSGSEFPVVRSNPALRCLRDAWYGLQIDDLVLVKYAVAKALVWEESFSVSSGEDGEYLYELVDFIREQEAHDRAMMKRSEERKKQEEVA